MLAATFGGDLGVASAEHRMYSAGSHFEDVRALTLRAASGVAIELPCLPGAQSLLGEVGELIRVGGRLEGEGRQVAGHLMVAVAVRRCTCKARIDHQRAKHPDDPNHVAEHFALVPSGRSLGQGLGETEIERAGEELFAAIETPCLQQLFGPNDAKSVEQLGADDVLTAFPSVERQICDPGVVAPRRPCDERRVFVVRVCSRVEGASGRRQPLEELGEATGAQIVDWTNLRTCRAEAVPRRRRVEWRAFAFGQDIERESRDDGAAEYRREHRGSDTHLLRIAGEWGEWQSTSTGPRPKAQGRGPRTRTGARRPGPVDPATGCGCAKVRLASRRPRREDPRSQTKRALRDSSGERSVTPGT